MSEHAQSFPHILQQVHAQSRLQFEHSQLERKGIEGLFLLTPTGSRACESAQKHLIQLSERIAVKL